MMTPRSSPGSGSSLLASAATSRIMLKEPIRLIRITRSNSGSGIGPSRPTMRLGVPTPAQLIRMRAAPCRSRASLSAATALSASATSHRTAIPPILSATWRAPSRLTSSTATLAPAWASWAAVSAPRPEPPPVTTAACPFGSIVAFLLPKTWSPNVSEHLEHVQPHGQPLARAAGERDDPVEPGKLRIGGLEAHDRAKVVARGIDRVSARELLDHLRRTVPQPQAFDQDMGAVI